MGILLLFSLLAYINSFNTPLLLDSEYTIVNDTRVHRLSLQNLRRILMEDYASPQVLGMYRPVTTLSLSLNRAVSGGGPHPLKFHVVNFILHYINAVLLLYLLARMLPYPTAALAGAVLFALHPVTTDAVTNVIGRSDLLVTFFVLTAILAARSPCSSSASQPQRLLLVSLSSLLACLSKENGFVVPALIIAMDFPWATAGTRIRELPAVTAYLFRNRWPVYAAAFAPAVLVGVWRLWLYRSFPPTESSMLDNVLVGAKFLSWQLTAWSVVGRYLSLFVLPLWLSYDYSYDQIPIVQVPPSGLYDWHALGVLIMLAGITYLCMKRRTVQPAYLVFWSVFLVALLPASNVLLRRAAIMGLRFLYLPLIGLCGLAAQGLSDLVRAAGSRRSPGVGIAASWPWVLCGLVLLLLGARTLTRNFDWQSEEALFRADVQVCPRSFRTNGFMSDVLARKALREGQHVYIDSAIAYAERACAIVDQMPPEFWLPEPHVRLGRYCMWRANKMDRDSGVVASRVQLMLTIQAERLFKRVVDKYESPSSKQAAVALPRHAKLGSKTATRFIPAYYTSLTMLARIALNRGETVRAREYIARAENMRPDDPYLSLLTMTCAVRDGNHHAAAVAGVRAILLTPQSGREAIWPQLIEVYDAIDGTIAELLTHNGRHGLNTAHPTVRAHMHEAFAGIVSSCRRAGDAHRAESYRMIGIRRFGCRPEVFRPNAQSR